MGRLKVEQLVFSAGKYKLLFRIKPGDKRIADH